MKTCRGCDELLSLDSFYANPNTRDGRLNWCKPCTSKRYAAGRAERSRANRARIAAIKIARGCADCGYNAHAAALDFDHLPGVDKVLRISCMADSTPALLEAEIAKCEVVCANCHRIRTVNRLPEQVTYVKEERWRRLPSR